MANTSAYISWRLLFILATSISILHPVAHAKPKHATGPRIVGHLPSEANSALQMTFRLEDGFGFLYVEKDGSTTIINVTYPDKPRVVRAARKIAPENGGQVSPHIFVIDSSPPYPEIDSSDRPARNLRFMDTSNPSNPHPIGELSGATSMAVDRFRGLLFVSNAAGLWIVQDDGLIDPAVKIWNERTSTP